MSGEPAVQELSAVSRSVLEVLRSVSSLAWPILKAQAQMLGADPAKLQTKDLGMLVPRLVEAVARFGSRDKAERVRRALGGSAQREVVRSSPRLKSQRFVPQGKFAQQVLAELEQFSSLAWPLLEAQCRRNGIKAETLSPSQLGRVLDAVEQSIGRFASSAKARAARARLEKLMSEARAGKG